MIGEIDSGVTGDDAAPLAPPRVLTQAQIDEFMHEGVLVVPNVLSSAEVATARAGLHGELAKYGVVSHVPTFVVVRCRV